MSTNQALVKYEDYENVEIFVSPNYQFFFLWYQY